MIRTPKLRYPEFSESPKWIAKYQLTQESQRCPSVMPVRLSIFGGILSETIELFAIALLVVGFVLVELAVWLRNC